jgi:hypothetical protein
MLIETGIIATVIAAGKAADVYSTPKAKQIVGSWIAQAPHFDWHHFVAERSWFIYTTIFGAHSASLRFIITSSLLYILICLGSFLFLFLAFPSTYEAIASAWTYGTAPFKIWWLVAMVIGGGLYVLANAQTLYFLEILKTAPNLFKFLLVAYADFLITASVSLFGIPILLTVHTFGITHTDSSLISLKLDFSEIATPTTEEITWRLSGRTQAPLPPRSHNSYEIKYSFVDPSLGIAAQEADFQAIKDAIQSGQAQGQEQSDGQSISLRNADEEVIGSQERGKPFQGKLTIYNFDEEMSDNAFCHAVALGMRRGTGTLTEFTASPSASQEILSSCLGAKTTSLDLAIRTKVDNIRWGRVYVKYLLITLAEMTTSISSGFNSYLSLSPYTMLIDNPLYLIRRKESSDSPRANAERAFDQIAYDLHTFKGGSRNVVLHNGVPAGSVNVAIMSTALFNLVVMSIFFVAYPLVKVASKYDVFATYVDFEKSPFTILASLVGAWLAVLLAIVSFF